MRWAIRQKDWFSTRETVVNVSKFQSTETKLDWLQLYRSENVGPITFYRLLAYFGSAKRALTAIPEMARKGGAQRFKVFSRSDAEQEIAQITRLGGRLLIANDQDYPKYLKAIASAPPIVIVRGEMAILNRPIIAIVGGRNCSIAGRKCAWMVANQLSDAGYVIVSGLARGIDTAAHHGSLEKATCAVFAGGVDFIYPNQNQALAQAIVANGGALLSEQPVGYEPRHGDFPRRNRIIAGLAMAVVVIEAARNSGSLITANYAADFGREVFAVPGSPLDGRCEGGNRLIKDGANILTKPQDVIETLEPITKQKKFKEERHPPFITSHEGDPLTILQGDQSITEAQTDSAHGQIISALSQTPITTDNLIQELKTSPALIQICLLQLELAGRIELHPGGLISLA